MKNPPILISVIGFFAALAGFGQLFFGLRVLGFDWFGLFGDLPAYESVGLWGWLAIIVGIAWLMVAFGLWALQPWARTLALIVAGVGLFQAVLAFFQFPGSGIGLRDGPHAGPVAVVPEHGRGQGRLRRGTATRRLTVTPKTASAPGHPGALPVCGLRGGWHVAFRIDGKVTCPLARTRDRFRRSDPSEVVVRAAGRRPFWTW